MANHELMKLTAHQVKEGHYDKAILAVGSCEAMASISRKAATLWFLMN